MEDLVLLLIEKGKTISSMESCTGGAFANAITNVIGASDVIKFSAITYSNEFKIKMGVDCNTISKYTVYSIQVAREMSKSISVFSDSDYGVGITGQFNRFDPNNISSSNNKIYVSIYDKKFDKYYDIFLEAKNVSREKNKNIVIDEIVKLMKNLCK